MKASKTSKQWMREHINDPYVQRAQKDGYRSRAAYKLLEIDEHDHLIKPGMVVVDLGATPGGWCQVVANKLGDKGRIIALDLLPLHPLPRVEFIQGDFREDSVLAQLEELLNGQQIGLVISDMAPNISGIDSADQARAMHLAELALDLGKQFRSRDRVASQGKEIVVGPNLPESEDAPPKRQHRLKEARLLHLGVCR